VLRLLNIRLHCLRGGTALHFYRSQDNVVDTAIGTPAGRMTERKISSPYRIEDFSSSSSSSLGSEPTHFVVAEKLLHILPLPEERQFNSS
jgi:hypothetical protein